VNPFAEDAVLTALYLHERVPTEQKSIYFFQGLWRRRHIFPNVPASANERLVDGVQVFAFREVRSDSARSITALLIFVLRAWHIFPSLVARGEIGWWADH
jgi:hypothetical protein